MEALRDVIRAALRYHVTLLPKKQEIVSETVPETAEAFTANHEEPDPEWLAARNSATYYPAPQEILDADEAKWDTIKEREAMTRALGSDYGDNPMRSIMRVLMYGNQPPDTETLDTLHTLQAYYYGMQRKPE
jgi:hypothetical protein